MKLGALLVRDGLLAQAKLDDAVALQQRIGGRLGTVLVEMGLVDLETLTVYLGLELGIPIATGATLDRAKYSAVKLLTPQQAARLRALPLLVHQRQLITAVDDPNDLVVLDELAQITGCRIIPRIAPEIRIHYYLERYYGVPRPRRFRRMGELPRGPMSPRAAAVTANASPSLPGLPPMSRSPVVAPTPAPPLRPISRAAARAAARPAAGPAAEAEELALEANELVVELDADDAEPAEEVEPSEVILLDRPRVRTAPPEQFSPLAADDAVAAIAGASRRGEIAAALLSFARGLFDVAALLIVRDQLAFGWKGFGPELDRERIETLLVPLEAPSIVQMAVAAEGLMYAGPVNPSALHDYLFRVLRTPAPRQAVVAAVIIGKRVVNLLIGLRLGDGELDKAGLESLHRVARAAGDAYVHLIALSKSGGGREQPTHLPARTAHAHRFSARLAVVVVDRSAESCDSDRHEVCPCCQARRGALDRGGLRERARLRRRQRRAGRRGGEPPGCRRGAARRGCARRRDQ